MRIAAVFLFLVTLGLYTYTLAPTVASQGDSGELVTVAYTLGVAHPPGYPVYTLIGHLFSLIPYFSVAWRLNFMAAVMHGVTVVLVFLILKKLLGNVLAALTGAMALALSYTFWLYSLIAEVFSLNDLLAVAIIYGLLEKRFLIVSLLFGLGMSNNHTIILLAPAALYFFLASRGKLSVKLVIFSGVVFLLGLLPYLYLLVVGWGPGRPVAWSYPANWRDVWGLFTRADYGTLAPTAGIDPALALVTDKVRQLSTYFRFLVDDFGLVGLVLASIGAIGGLVRRERTAIFIFVAFFFSAVFFLTYANFPYNEGSGMGLEVTERFYLLPNVFVAVFLAFGVSFLARFCRDKFGLRFLVWPSVLIFLVVLLISHLSLVNQRDNYLGLELGKDILRSAPEKSLLFIFGDVPTFTAMYARYVEGFRPDVEIVTSPKNGFRYLISARPELDLALPKVASPAGFVLANYDRAPIMASTSISYIPPTGFVATPSGMLARITKKEEVVNFSIWQKETEENLVKYGLVKNVEQLRQGKTAGDFVIQSYVVAMYGNLGAYCLKVNQYDCAVRYFSLAHEVDPLRIESVVGLAQALEKAGRCKEAEENYLLVLKLNPTIEQVYTSLYKLATDCFHDSERAAVYKSKSDAFEKKSRGDLKNL